MPWRKIKEPDKLDAAEFTRAFRKRARFLLDEDLPDGLARALRKRGWNARTVDDLGLRGRPDEQVLAAALRDDRMLLTQDSDFLDEGRFSPHRNPGIVVLPGGSGDVNALVEALGTLLPIVGGYSQLFRGDYIRVSSDGVLSVTSRDETGAQRTARYRFARGGAEEWASE